jgi:hypothetical protein
VIPHTGSVLDSHIHFLPALRTRELTPAKYVTSISEECHADPGRESGLFSTTGHGIQYAGKKQSRGPGIWGLLHDAGYKAMARDALSFPQSKLQPAFTSKKLLVVISHATLRSPGRISVTSRIRTLLGLSESMTGGTNW